jgi:hypothetical protein
MSNPIKYSRFYYTFNYPTSTTNSKTILTGIRQTKTHDKVLITGFYEQLNNPTITFIYKGKLNGKGKWHTFSYPSSDNLTVTSTNLCGPNNDYNKQITAVGNYTTQQSGMTTFGCLYQGLINNTGIWTTLTPTSVNLVISTIAHSTMGNLVVGNYDTQLNEGIGFIYDIKKKVYYDITLPTTTESVTAYGIYHNGNHSYTICGGYSDITSSPKIEFGYIINWNNKTKVFTDFHKYNYNNDIKNLITHFDGITTDNKGGYFLTGDNFGINDLSGSAFVAHINKNKIAKWELISYPKADITSGNSILDDTVIGVYTDINDQSVNGFISLKFDC